MLTNETLNIIKDTDKEPNSQNVAQNCNSLKAYGLYKCLH